MFYSRLTSLLIPLASKYSILTHSTSTNSALNPTRDIVADNSVTHGPLPAGYPSLSSMWSVSWWVWGVAKAPCSTRMLCKKRFSNSEMTKWFQALRQPDILDCFNAWWCSALCQYNLWVQVQRLADAKQCLTQRCIRSLRLCFHQQTEHFYKSLRLSE